MAVSFRPSPDALLNPCADPIFKSLFTQESTESRQALSCFLSDLLQKNISDVILQPNELSVETLFDRQTQFDLTCKADSEPVNIEMQGVNLHSLFANRAEYYAAHLLNHYVGKGMDETEIPKVYQISVLNFIINKKLKNGFSHYIMKSIDGSDAILGERLNVIFLELPKILKLDDNVKNLTKIEQWGKFFTYACVPEKQDFLSELKNANKGIKYAMEALDFLSKEELEWQRETSYWKFVMDYKTGMNEAKRNGYAKGHAEGLEKGIKEGLEEGRNKGLSEGLEQGLKEGLKEGLEQGLEEGHAKGLAEGLAEGELKTKQVKDDIAKKLLKMNLPLEQIMKATNLSEEEIKAL